MRIDEGRKGWSILANLKMKVRTVAGGVKSLVSDPGSELQLGSEKEDENVQS